MTLRGRAATGTVVMLEGMLQAGTLGNAGETIGTYPGEMIGTYPGETSVMHPGEKTGMPGTAGEKNAMHPGEKTGTPGSAGEMTASGVAVKSAQRHPR